MTGTSSNLDQIESYQVSYMSVGSLEYAVVLSGLRLTMKDGSMWFHPYNGSKPHQIAGSDTPKI